MRALLALLTGLLALAGMAPAFAQSQVRLEYVIVHEGAADTGGGPGTTSLLGAQAPGGGWTYTVSAAAPLTGASAITPPTAVFTTAAQNRVRPHVRVSVMSGAVAVLTDPAATVSAANGRIVIQGADQYISLVPGDVISIIDLSATVTLPASGGGGGGGSVSVTATPPFSATASAVVATSSTSVATALPGAGDRVVLRNAGVNDITVLLGSSAAVATANDYLLTPGQSVVFSTTGVTHVAARSSGSGSLRISTGSGSIDALAVTGVLPAGDKTIGITRNALWSSALTITRPANTTPYSAGQIISTATSGLTALPTVLTTPSLGSNVQLTIQNVSVVSSNGAAATRGQFSVYFFNSASPAIAAANGGTIINPGLNDGQAFAPTAAALAAAGNCLFGSVGSSLPQTGGATYGYSARNDTCTVTTGANGSIAVALVPSATYQPVAGEVFYINISGTY